MLSDKVLVFLRGKGWCKSCTTLLGNDAHPLEVLSESGAKQVLGQRVGWVVCACDFFPPGLLPNAPFAAALGAACQDV